jgi:hypothetical protein
MNTLIAYTMLVNLKPRLDTSGLTDEFKQWLGSKIVWMLPTVTPVMGLPRVPDGSVANNPYIPPNTQFDIVTTIAELQKAGTRFGLAAAGGGAVLGLVAGYLMGRRKRRG